MAGNYQLPLVTRARQRGNFSAAITRTFVAMVIAALALAAAGIFWATHESDAASVLRQARSAQHAMDISVDELALQQETVSIWDDSASNLVADRPDMTWIHDNIGGWLNRIFGHDEVFILNGADKPIYAASDGARVPQQRYAMLERDLQSLLNSVRGRQIGPNGRHDRNPSRPLSVGNTVPPIARPMIHT